ncbi:type II toxin-antitoxin system VapC family toxin [Streptomyces sp. 21So2-11]|uniref:type II toxin-antitoxin system VapC family toxin n=1 Tax=Streptomyces sp. 21So2-11 TaxID=3144408 RepID=UPI00321ABC0F
MSLYYLDSCAVLKLVKQEAETHALRAWRTQLGSQAQLVTSQLAGVELARTFRRAGLDRQRVPFLVGNALKGVDQIVLDDDVLIRAAAYEVEKLGTLDAIHLATADPLKEELDGFVTYDKELSCAVEAIGFTLLAPGAQTN